ncbi:MAG: hypothetical protein ABI844_07500 [Saprospiraceae bacterium]
MAKILKKKPVLKKVEKKQFSTVKKASAKHPLKPKPLASKPKVATVKSKTGINKPKSVKSSGIALKSKPVHKSKTKTNTKPEAKTKQIKKIKNAITKPTSNAKKSPIAPLKKSIPINPKKTQPIKSKSVATKKPTKVENQTITPKIEFQKTIATVKAKIFPTLENKKKVTKSTTKLDVPPATNGKTRYSDSELAEFKKIIDEKLTASRQELNYLQEQIVEMNENNSDVQGSDWFDDSSIHTEVELLNNMAIRQRQFIQNLENALVRIDNKTYGICTVTGQLIDKKRLMLVPHATKSMEAKQIEKASMVPDLNTVAPDERVLRRTAEGKTAKKSGAKKSKGKSSKDFDDEEGDDMMEASNEELDISISED